MAEKPIQDIRRDSRRGITITLSPATVISSVTVLCAGFVLVFVLGILMGRGYNLEAAIPALDKVLPKAGESQPPVVVSLQDGQNGAGAPGRPAAPVSPSSARTPAETPPVRNEGTQPLAKNTAEAPGGAKSSDKPAAKPPVKPTEKPAAKPQPQQEASPAKPQVQPARAASPGQTAPVRTSAMTATPGADTQRYQYVYQAAAYRDQPSCDKFVAELKKAGFQARTLRTVEGSSIWYRTMIDFTGKPDDTDALRAALKNRGIPKLILKSKTLAGQ